jgi:hypothetical protein
VPPHVAAVERIEQRERAQQHALARTGGARDGRAVARMQREAGGVQQHLAARGIAAHDGAGFKKRRIGHGRGIRGTGLCAGGSARETSSSSASGWLRVLAGRGLRGMRRCGIIRSPGPGFEPPLPQARTLLPPS